MPDKLGIILIRLLIESQSPLNFCTDLILEDPMVKYSLLANQNHEINFMYNTFSHQPQ